MMLSTLFMMISTQDLIEYSFILFVSSQTDDVKMIKTEVFPYIMMFKVVTN